MDKHFVSVYMKVELFCLIILLLISFFYITFPSLFCSKIKCDLLYYSLELTICLNFWSIFLIKEDNRHFIY